VCPAPRDAAAEGQAERRALFAAEGMSLNPHLMTLNKLSLKRKGLEVEAKEKATSRLIVLGSVNVTNDGSLNADIRSGS
jgi:hypothetical protein